MFSFIGLCSSLFSFGCILSYLLNLNEVKKKLLLQNENFLQMGTEKLTIAFI